MASDGRSPRTVGIATAVVLAVAGGTPAPPAPPDSVSLGEQRWTDGAYRALVDLMDRESMEDVVVVGHWITGTGLALRLAIEHPERIRAVVLLAGAPRSTTSNPEGPVEVPHEDRVKLVDEQLAPEWFRTVTRETWDDNNFRPGRLRRGCGPRTSPVARGRPTASSRLGPVPDRVLRPGRDTRSGRALDSHAPGAPRSGGPSRRSRRELHGCLHAA